MVAPGCIRKFQEDGDVGASGRGSFSAALTESDNCFCLSGRGERTKDDAGATKDTSAQLAPLTQTFI